MSQYKIMGLANPSIANQSYKIIGKAPLSDPKENQGNSSIPEDIGNAGLNLLMSAGEKAMKLPEEAQEAANQFIENPFKASHRASKNVLSSLVEGGKQLYNLPLNINTYLGSKNIPFFKKIAPLAEKLKIGDTGLEKKFLGESQPGDELWKDIGSIAPLIVAPEVAGFKAPAVTSKAIMKQLSKSKQKALIKAKEDYSNLFKDANEMGLFHAIPSLEKNYSEIINNSHPKFHTSLIKYLKDPTLENAHWAQSELGAFIRHLDKQLNKNGLTPSEIKTYKTAQDIQKSIKDSMFSENAFGKNPILSMRYQNLANKYKENVIPYTGLEELASFEKGKIRPKTAVKKLLNDEEFMMKLSKKYPGIFLHTPTARNIGLGAAGLLGYDELKKLLKSMAQ